jgi:hypothetical protein
MDWFPPEMVQVLDCPWDQLDYSDILGGPAVEEKKDTGASLQFDVARWWYVNMTSCLRPYIGTPFLASSGIAGLE